MDTNYCDDLDIRASHLLAITVDAAQYIRRVYNQLALQESFHTGCNILGEYVEQVIDEDGNIAGAPESVVLADIALRDLSSSPSRMIWPNTVLFAYLSHVHRDKLSDEQYHALTRVWNTILQFSKGTAA